MFSRLQTRLHSLAGGFASARLRPGSRARSVVALAFALSSIGIFSAPSSALGWSTGAFSSADEAKLVALTNQARASAGLKALVVDSTLTSIARWRSKDMIDRNYFDHAIPNPPGGTVFNEMKRRGYCYNSAGENIGENQGYSDSSATNAIQALFMSSPGHKANILGTSWDRIGIGAYKGAGNKKMWTVVFADRCGTSSAPAPKPKPKPTPRPAPRVTPRPTAHPTATAKPAVTVTPVPTPTTQPTPYPTPPIASGAGGPPSNRELGALEAAGIVGVQGWWVVVNTSVIEVARLQMPWADLSLTSVYGAAEALLGPY
ncbi:MAG TPA: CAP domain-containing protein [Candidatus Acidoferrum sp.]|nr:CAP domain-containing protein [Candidatus Acidoferrum sp.]